MQIDLSTIQAPYFEMKGLLTEQPARMKTFLMLKANTMTNVIEFCRCRFRPLSRGKHAGVGRSVTY